MRMYLMLFTSRRCNNRFHLHRSFCSRSSKSSVEHSGNLRSSNGSLPLPVVHQNSSITAPSSPSNSFLVRLLTLSAAAVSFTIAASYYTSSDKVAGLSNPFRITVEEGISRTNESFRRVFHHARQTGSAASVLLQSLRSVMSSANHEFELRVASLLADIAAANASRRSALVAAGGGKVIDWLLEAVAAGDTGKDGRGTQAEAARALAYLIADPNVVQVVLGRPNAIPCLLRFIFSCQPKKQKLRRNSFDASDSMKGRSMLVAAILDIVTANCETVEKTSVKPILSSVAETRDIAAAIEVIEEGGYHLRKSNDGEDEDDDGDDDDDGGRGLKGIGIKILEGTTSIGLARTGDLLELEYPVPDNQKILAHSPKLFNVLQKDETSVAQRNIPFAIVPGLWDDLHSEHVAVPFAAWALADWAMASEINRSHIQDLDQDGNAVMSALMAPERSVKWHGSLIARFLLEDRNLSLSDSVADWCSSLLSTISLASDNGDISLVRVAIPAFLLSIERCQGARKITIDKGLENMRLTAKRTRNYKQIQEALAKALELLCNDRSRFSLEDSQKWSGILLPWIFNKTSTEKLRSSATKILSSILEEYGPDSVPIAQVWLAVILHEVLGSAKTSSDKESTQPNTEKVKTPVNQANVANATQICSQLAVASVNLAMSQHGKAIDSAASFPLADLFSLDPLAGPFRSAKKDAVVKIDVADSAIATLKGIKALTELCSDYTIFQNKIVDLGIFCLLRRLLLNDDYEKLAAIKAYDASKADGMQLCVSKTGSESNPEAHDPPAVRVPPTAHIRKHAARLLVVLSGHPKVQRSILEDKVLLKWLEGCAGGKIPGCADPKLQSYSRSILLNASCYNHTSKDTFNSTGITSKRISCPRYHDVILLINPERSHWKSQEFLKPDVIGTDASVNSFDSSENGSMGRLNDSEIVDSCSSGYNQHFPPIDVVFVHGLRGGPYKSWRLADDNITSKSELVEKIDEEAGKLGTFWPGEWLSEDFRDARLFTLKYKTNLTQWSGATLPLQEVSSKLLESLIAAGIGNRPVVFVTHSMGGLVVKQILHRAKAENMNELVKNTVGIVFYSCPHFGSKLADMPWRMGLVLRPAPTIGELRSGSPRLVELNDFIRQLHKKGSLDVLSFGETKVTPIVEGYGGWAIRVEIVPIESAYPGYGELVVLESTNHINSCKPTNRTDPSYAETLQFLHKLKEQYS